jgi:hypothetical protein
LKLQQKEKQHHQQKEGQKLEKRQLELVRFLRSLLG